MLTRVEKATAYMNNHRAKGFIVEDRKAILAELNNLPSCVYHKIVHGSAYGCIKMVTDRFRAGFYAQEYMDIVTGLTEVYTEKQLAYYEHG